MALKSPDGRLRVEVVQKGAQVGYRLWRDGAIWTQWTGIGAVEHLLQQEGVSMADLIEAAAKPAQGAA